MVKLTKRQQEILKLIESRMLELGAPPTRAEIAKTMGFQSPNAAEDHLRALARKGVIELVPGTSRGIRLARNSHQIPVVSLNQIDSTTPILSQSRIGSTCKLDLSFFQAHVDYLLHVTDRSIPELSIAQGDYLAICTASKCTDGQIGVLRLPDSILIERYSPTLELPALIVEGVVVGVIRSLAHPLNPHEQSR